MDLEIILPVYNEKPNLKPLTKEIDEVFADRSESYRIIMVDDGSSDGSSKLIQELAENRDSVLSIHFRENFGQSAAFAAGFEKASAAVVVTLDADGQNDPAEIPEMLSYLDTYDLVAGYRANREDNWLRTFGSQVANQFRNWITGDNIIDTGCSLKVFRKEVVKNIPMYEGMHRFLPTLARMEGYTVKQVPTNHRPRRRGKTKYSLSGRLITTVWDLLSVRWMQKRYLDYEIEESEY